MSTVVMDVDWGAWSTDVVEEPADAELLHQVEQRIVNSFNTEFLVERLHEKIEEGLEAGVADAACVLDEWVPDWYRRIDREIIMTSVYSCVLGQVFGGDRFDPVDGYLRGMLFFQSVGYNPPKFVFSSTKARPFWEAEVSKRSGGAG